ncbi:hypothetical protein [Moorena sp. SIO3A2]|uniref:hypothetical protein n=1 Tax=Moorena sp. SIO3A2 TaxID=2607841 RepID=UPI0013B6377A|nr:hypothetical protein [Moorena sp. SIO3A2]NER90322.1 hypothetical protein [Moorena sp. SIO3A2]
MRKKQRSDNLFSFRMSPATVRLFKAYCHLSGEMQGELLERLIKNYIKEMEWEDPNLKEALAASVKYLEMVAKRKKKPVKNDW